MPIWPLVPIALKCQALSIKNSEYQPLITMAKFTISTRTNAQYLSGLANIRWRSCGEQKLDLLLSRLDSHTPHAALTHLNTIPLLRSQRNRGHFKANSRKDTKVPPQLHGGTSSVRVYCYLVSLSNLMEVGILILQKKTYYNIYICCIQWWTMPKWLRLRGQR